MLEGTPISIVLPSTNRATEEWMMKVVGSLEKENQELFAVFLREIWSAMNELVFP